MTKKIAVVTGGNGFLGSKVVSSLLDANYFVRLILRIGSHHELKECVEIIYTNDLDFESVEWWTAATLGADIVIHCAWYVEHGLYMESSKNINSLHGLTKIAFGSLDSGVRKFIGIGTCLEYGDPFSSLDKSISPSSLYASSKLSAFFILTQIFKNSNTKFLWCRLYYLYGDGESPSRLVPYIKRQIENDELVTLNNGSKMIDILEITVAAKMIVNASLSDDYGPIDIRSNQIMTIRDFAKGIAKMMRKEWLVK